MWILKPKDPSVEGPVFEIPEGSVKTVGRSAGAELVVEAPLVSRLHCQLSAGADAIRVKDLGSTNGTFVNGTRVTAAELWDGDSLSIGRLDLLVSRNL